MSVKLIHDCSPANGPRTLPILCRWHWTIVGTVTVCFCSETGTYWQTRLCLGPGHQKWWLPSSPWPQTTWTRPPCPRSYTTWAACTGSPVARCTRTLAICIGRRATGRTPGLAARARRPRSTWRTGWGTVRRASSPATWPAAWSGTWPRGCERVFVRGTADTESQQHHHQNLGRRCFRSLRPSRRRTARWLPVPWRWCRCEASGTANRLRRPRYHRRWTTTVCSRPATSVRWCASTVRRWRVPRRLGWSWSWAAVSLADTLHKSGWPVVTVVVMRRTLCRHWIIRRGGELSSFARSAAAAIVSVVVVRTAACAQYYPVNSPRRSTTHHGLLRPAIAATDGLDRSIMNGARKQSEKNEWKGWQKDATKEWPRGWKFMCTSIRVHSWIREQ